MSLSGKLVFAVEIKSPGIDVFDIFGIKKEGLPKITPNKFPVIELLAGNWGEVGCTLSVHYLIDGKRMISTENITAADREKMSMTYAVFEGDFMKLYKTFKLTFQVSAEGGKNFMNFTLEYEKQNAEIPSPHNFLEFITEVTNMVDAYLLKNASQTHA